MTAKLGLISFKIKNNKAPLKNIINYARLSCSTNQIQGTQLSADITVQHDCVFGSFCNFHFVG